MKCKIFGQIVTREYGVKDERKENEILRFKPYLIYKDSIEHEEILETNMDLHNFSDYSNTDICGMRFSISEEEDVYVYRRVFRADLGEFHLFTKKEIKLNEINKESSEALLEKLLKEWNNQQVEANQDYADYCKLHGLNPEEVDLDLLRKLVPNKSVTLHKGGLTAHGLDWATISPRSVTFDASNIGVIKGI